MEGHAYHHYLFFEVGRDFYRESADAQDELKEELRAFLESAATGSRGLMIVPYATLGFKAGTTFMLWCRAKDPADVQMMLRGLLRTKFGGCLTIRHSYFGIVRNSEYSGRTGKPEQVMQNFEDRLPYFVLYPFVKTAEWHALDFDARRAMMGDHVKVGLSHPNIRQCLLYSYGVDDQEFLVSYEMGSLEEFQDLVMEMRRTQGRKYTLADTPIFTCTHKTLPELLAWL